MDADIQRKKLLNLNKLQTLLIIFGTAFGIMSAVAAWAHGWLGLPDKVSRIESKQQPLVDLPNRVATIEYQDKSLWYKLSADHDVLTAINQNLADSEAATAGIATGRERYQAIKNPPSQEGGY